MHPLCCQENFDDFGIAKIPALCLSHDAYATGLKCEYMRAGRSPNSVVACYSIEGILIKVYPTAKRAALSLHHHPRTIDKAIRENKVIHNRIWRRFPDGEVPEKVEPFYKPTITYNPKPIGLLDDNNNVVKAYSSVRSAAIDNEVDPHTIRDMLYRKTKTAHGKRYRYLSEEDALRFGIVISHDFDRVRIRQYSLTGKLIKIHDSYKDAAITVGVDKSAISYCVNKGGKTVKDFFWIRDDEHAEEKLAELMARKRFFYTAIVQFDKKGKEVARYKSAKEAERTTGINSRTITQAIRKGGTAKGYYWKGEKN